MQYTIRKATTKDLNILDLIHTENMKGYVEKVYPWNYTMFCDRFIADNYQVVEINNKIIGFIKVVSSDTEIYLAEIQIARDYQNQGIGTSLIKSAIKKARMEQKNLWLKVLKGNPAKNLYQRLGFEKLKDSVTHDVMRKKDD